MSIDAKPKRMAVFFVWLMALSLTENRFPAFNVVAILALFPLRLFWKPAATPDRWLGPVTAIRFALAAYAFWILSYLLTTASPASMLSYDFLRYNGALLIAYLPLILLGDLRLSSKIAYRIIWAILVVLAVIAVLGAAMFLLTTTGHLILGVPLLGNLLEVESGHVVPLMFLGLYRTHMTTGEDYSIAALVSLCLILRQKKPKMISWASLIFICLIAGMILSGARTSYLAFGGAFLFLFSRYRKRSRAPARALVLLLAPVIALVVVSPSFLLRAESIIFIEGHHDVMDRFQLFHEAFNAFVQSPLIGMGLGRFDESGKTYSGIPHLALVATDGTPPDETLNAFLAHNSYLQFLAEGGVVGLFLMLGIWTSTYFWAGRLQRLLPEGGEAEALCFAIQAAVLVTFISSFTGTTMMMATTPLMVFTFVGLLRNIACSVWRAQTETPTFLDGLPG